LGGGLYKVLALPEGVLSDETWEFPPGSIVRGKKITLYEGVTLKCVLIAAYNGMQ
jgi:hypothetical protein